MALYTYESPEPGDLTFRVGDLVLVSKREGEWWSGSIGDRTGLFPGNYVKPKETDVRTLYASRIGFYIHFSTFSSLSYLCIDLLYICNDIYVFFRHQAHLERKSQVNPLT